VKNVKAFSLLCFAAMLVAGLGVSLRAAAADGGQLSVAVAEPDIEAIVLAVGGNQVDTFSLFKGCILSSNLHVESDAARRLAKADVIVRTSFLKESAEINARLNKARTDLPKESGSPGWIDISKGAGRGHVPNRLCPKA
jgi:ABC-type Zn uptake system ZnuABC Zn-binding protein ZnuA